MEWGELATNVGPDEQNEADPNGEEFADDRTWEDGKPPQGLVWSGLRCRRAKEDMVVVVGVVAPQKEDDSETGEETGDHAEVSTFQSPLSSAGADDEGTTKDRRVLTLEYRDSKGFEARVRTLRPRNRAKYSHRRIACRVWRFHCGVCLKAEPFRQYTGPMPQRKHRLWSLTRFSSCHACSCS